MTRTALVVHSLGQGGTVRVAVPGDAESGALRDAISDRVAVHVLGKRRRQRGRVAGFLAAFLAWVRWLRHERPDVVVSTGNNASWFAAAGFLLRGYPGGRLFIKVTNPILKPGRKGVGTAFRRRLYAATFGIATGVLTLSAAERRVLGGQFPEAASKIRAVANPYVLPEMIAAGAARNVATLGGARRVIAIGRLNHQKNFALLIRAWAAATRGASTLTIVGDGPDREALRQLAQSLGVASSITFAGFQADILPWLKAADLFVLSSAYEGLPAVVLEAFAAECPVIATACFDAAHELVHGAPGCTLVPPGDVQAMADAITRALAEPAPLGGLAQRAMPYAIDAAVASHRRVLLGA